jgi:hypothetical protein
MQRKIPALVVLIVVAALAVACNPFARKPQATVSPLASGVPVATIAVSGTVTATVVAVGTPITGTVAATAGVVNDYASFVAALQGAGATIEQAGNTAGSIFTGTGHIVRINGGEVQAFEYADAAAADAEAAKVSPDGSKFGNAIVDWVAAPHFYKQGRLMVVYVGGDQAVTNTLSAVLGQPFAGAGAVAAGATTPEATAASAQQANCTDKAMMTQDVTIPDNTKVQAGQAFVKTWRLKNTGTCTWNNAYAMVFAKGNQMGGPDSVPFPGSVAPGRTVDISVNLTAPGTAGVVKGNWTLRNAAGKTFGITNSSDKTFWLQIVVSGSAPAASAPTRINFPVGGTAVTVQATLTQGKDRRYVLKMLAGQNMTVQSSGDMTLSVLGPDGKPLTGVTQGTDMRQWNVPIAKAGDYTLVLGGQGQMSVTVKAPPAGAATPAATSAPATTSAERLTFAAGATTVARELDLTSGPKSYVLSAVVNQQMRVIFTQPGVTLTVTDPQGNALDPLSVDPTAGSQYRLPLTGDYTLALDGKGQTKMAIAIPPAGKINRAPVTFAAGATSATLNFTLKEGETQEYVVSAKANQHLGVAGAQAGLSLLVYDAKGALMQPTTVDENGRAEYVLPADGDYVVSAQGAGAYAITLDIPAS